MTRFRYSVVSLFICLHILSPAAAERPLEEWLRGSGEDLEICLSGEVFDADGRPATGAEVAASMNFTAVQPFQASIDGHRFKIWIPVNRHNWPSLVLRASSANSDHVAYATLNAYQLRQAAIEGVKLTLKPPTRRINVKVTDQGEPVPEAWVKATLKYGIELRSTTDAHGIARISLLPEQQLSQLTAWTADCRVGGFGFSRRPVRDPEADEHVIELSSCLDQKLRFIDEDGMPVPDVSFVLQIATPAPNYNYIGTTDESRLTTNAAGEAIYRWFPVWEDVHFYAEVDGVKWIVERSPLKVGDCITFTLKHREARKHVPGRVLTTGTSTVPAGFYVSMRSSQGELESTSDLSCAFSDPDGTYSVAVLPDATYCAYVMDEKWVGKIIDVLPYESVVDKVTPTELEITQGQPIEVEVTSGPHRRPISNLTVRFRRYYRYSWFEDGEQTSGSGGSQWSVTTDESGIASTRTLPGRHDVSVYTPRWRTEKEITVAADETARIELHREIDEKRIVTGQIVLDAELESRFEDIQVRAFSLDGNYQDEQTLSCTEEGEFSFETFASEIGIFASSRDGQVAGSMIAEELNAPIQLKLLPTGQFQGHLLGEGDQPVVNHPVRANVRFERKRTSESRFGTIIDLKKIETTTDQDGNYTLAGIPVQTKTVVLTDEIDGSGDSIFVAQVNLEPGESPPPTVTNLVRTADVAETLPLAQRYKTTLRDCALNGYRLMVIIAEDRQGVLRFINENYANYERNESVYSLMHIIVTSGKSPLDPADVTFLKKRNWPLPRPGVVVAIALDDDGEELGRQEIDLEQPSAAEAPASFIQQHAPARQDAEEAWNAALAEASRTNRRVWARVSGRNCGFCYVLSRWLDDQRALLEKDYVMLRIDDFRDLHGNDVAERIVRGQQGGIPFHAIFDASGELLIDSVGPRGNIGSARSEEGKKHLRRMLEQTRQHLSDDEVDQIVEIVTD